MSNVRKCSKCGATLNALTPEGLCARCMLLSGLGSARDDEENLRTANESSFTTSAGAVESFLPPQGGQHFGDYQLLEELGRGGMGVVFKARQLSLNRVVALKMIQSQRLASAALVQRFRMEAEAAASLRHPNIVAIHEIGEHTGQHFFSMDFIEGQSLAERVKGEPLPARAAADCVRKIAEAVHHAHQHGILHRDLKPANILIRSDGEPHVTDFGLAKRIEADSALTLTGEILGSPAYMAPEQASGSPRQVTVAADIYSLGAILYELLTGRAPFAGVTPIETVHKVIHELPTAPEAINASVPRDLAVICFKCLEKEPHRRYATAQELVDELGRFLRDEPIQARAVGRAEKLWRWSRRNRVVAGLSAAAILASVFGLAGIAWQWRQAVAARKGAETATRDKQEQLWRSQLIEARYFRTSAQAGQQTRPLPVIGEAAKWRPSLELRNEAIAALLLPDLGTNTWFRKQPGMRYHFACDADFEHYMPDLAGRVEVRRTRDHSVAASFEGLSVDPSWSQFSPDGQRLAVYFGRDGTNSRVGLWDWQGRRRLLNVVNGLGNGHAPVFDFTPDGRELVVATQSGPVRRFDVETGRELEPPLLSLEASAVRLSPSGQAVALHRRGELQVWSLTRSQQVAHCALPKGLEDIAWHPHEELLSIATSAGLFLWKVGPEDPVLISAANHITRTFFNPDGDLLLAGGWGNFCGIWDAGSGRLLLSNREGAPVQLSRDGGTLAYARERVGFGARRLLRPQSLRRLLVPVSQSGNHGTLDAQFYPQGRWLLSAHRQGWLLWDSVTARIVARHRSALVNTARFLPDGSGFVTCGHAGVQRWPLFATDLGVRVAEPEMVIASKPLQFERIAISPDGNRLGAVSTIGPSLVCQIEGPNAVTLVGSEMRPSNYIQFSPDGRWVMTGEHHGTRLNVYDAVSGQHVCDLPSGGGYGLFGPDGRSVLGVGPRGYAFWQIGSWELIRQIGQEDGEVTSSVCGFSPDGSYYLIGDLENHLRFRDAATHRDFATFVFPNTAAWGSCFDPSGQRLVVNNSRSELFLWDLAELRCELARLGLDWPEEHPGEGFSPRQARP